MPIKKLDPFATDLPIDRIIHIYQQAFGEAPWNEGYKCPKCEAAFPLSDTRRVCPDCDEPLIEYWPYETVRSDFFAQMKEPNAICLVTELEGRVEAFAWGYNVRMSAEFALKLDAPGVSLKLSGPFYYLDECAVEPRLQARGIGRALVTCLRSMERAQRFLVRTRHDCKMYPLLKSLGAEVVETITRNRVIMVF